MAVDSPRIKSKKVARQFAGQRHGKRIRVLIVTDHVGADEKRARS